ncbi:glycosyltransferase [Tepidamorphus sp. 3E244]|uniref:glycosyltransferase n=1 Tax=Tepidamorphus sp. 3E244 TaxID=3385498 RepID=UPI0038FC6B62
MRLLIVNVHFEPFSFGGATIVAEEMARRLCQDYDFMVFAASLRLGHLPCNSVVRHTTSFGVETFNIGVSSDYTYQRKYRNDELKSEFDRVVEYCQPDIVHVHCIQYIGAAFFDLLSSRSIPFVVTVHDHWWNCDRQFMVDVSGQYCGQKAIDLDVCVSRCMGERAVMKRRLDYLYNQIHKAALILTPSEFMRRFLQDNGFDHAKLVVNKNGVLPPTQFGGKRKSEHEPFVFGYVGGPGHLKGWNQIVEASRELDEDLADLFLIRAVDAGSLVGASWKNEFLASSKGAPIEVVQPYSQRTIDETFAGFDALLMPSNCRESFGLTAREASIRDIWVIASDAGGLAEDIVDGENGQILSFPPSSADLAQAMAEAIRRAPYCEMPHKERIVTLDDQAAELAGLLRKVIQGAA